MSSDTWPGQGVVDDSMLNRFRVSRPDAHGSQKSGCDTPVILRSLGKSR
jgi:hypothetical protein